MKTCQAAALICREGQGRVIAIEQNPRRFKILQEILANNCHSFEQHIETAQSDFLQLNPEDYPHVDCMILDVPCSGSGRHDTFDSDPKMLARLTNLQSRILRHAFEFPGLQKLVYSTCSVNVDENERVEDVLKDVKRKFKLVHAMPHWTRRGLNGQDKCLRVDFDLDLCTGFFVAVVKRKRIKYG